MQQLIWTWASPHHSATEYANSCCVQVMGHILWVSVKTRMNADVTRAMCEGWHVCVFVTTVSMTNNCVSTDSHLRSYLLQNLVVFDKCKACACS